MISWFSQTENEVMKTALPSGRVPLITHRLALALIKVVPGERMN
jgi:hypothetical protein